MYPYSTHREFALNHWYVAAWSGEITRSLMRRHILGTPVVFYRTEAGAPTAMIDMCPHRRFPLSQGKLIGDRLQCQYHGFTFAPDGACVQIPGVERDVSATHRVRTFPVVERWAWVWIWMGDPGLADPALIPNHHLLCLEREGWHPTPMVSGTIKARYALLHENLLDLSHISFLHEKTFGTEGVAATKVRMEQKDGYLEACRYVRDDETAPLPYAKALGMGQFMDRTMVQQFFPPSIHATGSAYNSPESEGVPIREYGAFRALHAVTPETATTSHYFVAISRNYLTDDEEITDMTRQLVKAAFKEDAFGAESVEANLEQLSDPSEEIHGPADSVALRGRQMMQNLLAAEADALPEKNWLEASGRKLG